MNVRVVGGVRAKPSVAFISSHKVRVTELICEVLIRFGVGGLGLFAFTTNPSQSSWLALLSVWGKISD